MIFLQVNAAKLIVTERETLTAKSKKAFFVTFSFSPEWDGLTRTAIFSNGTTDGTRSVIFSGSGPVEIPWESLVTDGKRLTVGVLGIRGEEIVLPTIYADLGLINRGAQDAAPTEPPTPGEYEQIIGIMEQTQAIAQSVRNDADSGLFDGADGVSPTVTVTPTEEGNRIVITDKDGDHTFDVTNGIDGTDGRGFYLCSSALNPQTETVSISTITLPEGRDILPLDIILSTVNYGTAKVVEDLGGGIASVEYLGQIKVSEHNDLEGRDASDSHPMSAITGLISALSGKQDTISDIATIRAGAGAGATALQPSALNPYRTASEQNAIDATKYEKPSSGIPASDLASAVQESLGRADSALQSVPDTYRTAAAQDVIDAGKIDKSAQTTKTSEQTEAVGIDANGKLWSKPGGGGGGTTDHSQLTNRDAANQHPMSAITGLNDALNEKGTYSKPSGGIPDTDLTSSVRSSLEKADSALQEHQSLAEYRKASAQDTIDNALQGQIDALVSKSDVVDVVGTYAELQTYDTSSLGENDVVKVLTDSTHSGARSYYRWIITGGVGAWSYVGSEAVGYTKAEEDALLAQKQNSLGFTPENVANKVTSISASSTDTQYPSAKAVYSFIQSLDGNGVSY